MCNKKERTSKWMRSSLYGHFSLCAHSLRTLLMVLFIVMMTFMLVKSHEHNISIRGYEVHLGETLFSYANSGFNIIMTSVAFLVMMSEIPKQTAYQNYMVMRLSRRKWLATLIVFCVGMVLIFIMMMLVGSMLFSLPFVTRGSGWSDLERLAVDKDYVYEMQLVPEYIRQITPFKACFLASAVLFFFWLTAAFLILLFSLLGIPNFGVVFCVSLLLLNITVLFENFPNMKLPAQFATLGAIAAQVEKNKIDFALMVLIAYVALDLILVALMAIRVHHMDIQFKAKN